ncbi:MAG: hypothetical protein V4773_14535 [Verrucomicrobiota bacterium]
MSALSKPEIAAAESAALKPCGGGFFQLASLPDPVGYAGNFAAPLGGRLLTGGGSQFPDKPLWLDGQKTYTDRIFALASLTGEWQESATRLPLKMAHFAAAASDRAIYLAGGMGAEGLFKQVFALTEKNQQLEVRALPELPRAVAYGAAAVANGRLYVAGGQHDPAVKVASKEVWSLDVQAGAAGAAWRREPDLPGIGAFVGAMASDGRTVYFIGGVGFDAAGKAVQSKKIYRLAVGATEWETLPDMSEPRVGPVTPCPVIEGKRIVVMGGYASIFPGERRDHPGFSAQTFIYDIAQGAWSAGPVLPHVKPTNKDATGDVGPAPMVAAPGAVWQDYFIAVGGEVRASVRTPSVVAIPLRAL